MGFVVYKVALGQVFLLVLPFSQVIIIPPTAHAEQLTAFPHFVPHCKNSDPLSTLLQRDANRCLHWSRDVAVAMLALLLLIREVAFGISARKLAIPCEVFVLFPQSL